MKRPIVYSPSGESNESCDTEGDDNTREAKIAKAAIRITARVAKLVSRKSDAMIGTLSENQMGEGRIVVTTGIGTDAAFISFFCLDAGRLRHKRFKGRYIEAWGAEWGCQKLKSILQNMFCMMRFNRRCGLHSRT